MNIACFSTPSVFILRLAILSALAVQPAAIAQVAGRTSPGIDIPQYGAKCDGASDDTRAIQAAIDSGNEHLVVPQGTCILAPQSAGEVLHVPPGSSLWVQGEGMGISILRIKPHAGEYSSSLDPSGEYGQASPSAT
jgi:hypothetical protein